MTPEERVRASFEKQAFMGTLGARLASVEAGAVDIELPFDERLTQQHGFLHAGAVASVVDSACGYAALTLMDADVAVLTVEYKINLLEPADGDVVVAEGRVVRAGRNLTICRGDARAGSRHIATATATLAAVRGRTLSH